MYSSMYKISKKTIVAVAAFLCMLYFIYDSRKISIYTLEGFIFAVKIVISSVFPFMFLSNILISTSFAEKIAMKLLKPFLKLKINPYILPPYIIGLFCGFPVGALYLKDLYDNGKISKKEADVLLPMCNNPSPAFVISTIGGIYLKSSLKGFLLWLFCIVISTVITMIFLPKYSLNKIVCNYRYDKYLFSRAFTESSKKTLNSSLIIFTLISFFYLLSNVLCDLLMRYNIPHELVAISVSFLEIGSGCSINQRLSVISSVFYAYAVGFGGLCVFFQVQTSAHTNCNMLFYFFSKNITGILCAFFALFLL